MNGIDTDHLESKITTYRASYDSPELYVQLNNIVKREST